MSVQVAAWVNVVDPGGGGGGETNQMVGWIGDSLTTQDPDGDTNDGPGEANIKAALVATGWSTSSRVDGLAGRKIRDGSPNPATPTVISNWRADGFDPSTWVFALGNNSWDDGTAKWTSDINANLNDIANGGDGPYTVYLFGMTSPTDNSQYALSYIATIRDIADANTRPNMVVIPADLNAALHTGEDESTWWQPTGIHMNATGYAWRNQVMCNMIGGAPRDHDWSETNPPWAYTSTNEWESRIPAGANVVNIQTGSTDFRTNLQNTINAAGGRCIVRLGTGTYHMDSFNMYGQSGNPLYAFGYWHPDLQGFIGDGPDKTIIQMDANSMTQDQLDAMTTMPSMGAPLQTGCLRLDGSPTSVVFCGGLTFRAADQQNITAVDSSLSGDVVVPQPAPHQGIVFYNETRAIMSHLRFQAFGRACTNAPPFEMANFTSQTCSIQWFNVESDGRLAADLDDDQGRRCTIAMMNNDYHSSFQDCWMHHSNVSRYAVNDQNRSTSGNYIMSRCKLAHMRDNHNTDPDLNGGQTLGGATHPMDVTGYESTAALVIWNDCDLTQNATADRHARFTNTGGDPQGGRLYVNGGTFHNTGNSDVDGYVTIWASSNTHWGSDGYATTMRVTDPDGNRLTAYHATPYPPSAATLSAASVTPQTHYIVKS